MSKIVRGIGSSLGLTTDVDIPEPKKEARVDEGAEARQAADEVRRRRGRGANVLTSPTGTGAPQTASRRLLGTS